MDGLTLLQKANAAGLTVSVSGSHLVIRGPRSAESLARKIMARKSEILGLLFPRTVYSDTELEQSFCRLADTNIALRIESSEMGRVWLISNEQSRKFVEEGDQVYTASEARLVVRLTPAEVRMVHGLKRCFGGHISEKTP
jgi:hypothetical protein